MNTTNKKPRKDIWKVVLMALELVAIVLLVLFMFTYSWNEATPRRANNRRPDLNDVVNRANEYREGYFYAT